MTFDLLFIFSALKEEQKKKQLLQMQTALLHAQSMFTNSSVVSNSKVQLIAPYPASQVQSLTTPVLPTHDPYAANTHNLPASNVI